MTWVIPTSSVWTLKRKDKGVVVYGLQAGMNSVGFALVKDGAFGVQTEQAVKNYQASAGLKVDGVFGPASSAALAESLTQKVGDGATPSGLLKNIVTGESGALLGAINATVPGGIDCGYCQRRVLTEDFGSDAIVQNAFDGERQMRLLRDTLVGRHAVYYNQPGAKTHERAWRLATLYHNYPYAAAEYAAGRWPSTQSLKPAAWVQAVGAKFPDGQPIQTPHEWCCHYALGDPAHNEPGFMCKNVTSWAV